MKDWFSAADLAALGQAYVAGLPATGRGNRARAEREGWEARQVKGKGGPGGVKTEYKPDAKTLRLIAEHFSHVSAPSSAEILQEAPTEQSKAGQAAGQVLEQDGYAYSPDLLESVVRGVEEFIRAHGLDPSPEKKAIAISLMYRYAIVMGSQLSTSDIEKFLKLAA